jgi:hypothetical protein
LILLKFYGIILKKHFCTGRNQEIGNCGPGADAKDRTPDPGSIWQKSKAKVTLFFALFFLPKPQLGYSNCLSGIVFLSFAILFPYATRIVANSLDFIQKICYNDKKRHKNRPEMPNRSGKCGQAGLEIGETGGRKDIIRQNWT